MESKTYMKWNISFNPSKEFTAVLTADDADEEDATTEFQPL